MTQLLCGLCTLCDAARRLEDEVRSTFPKFDAEQKKRLADASRFFSFFGDLIPSGLLRGHGPWLNPVPQPCILPLP